MAKWELDPGLVLKERYRVERELGRGGIGVVYKAVDQQLHSKPVVVKVLLDHAGLEDKTSWIRKKFQLELEALARLDHPGIVAVFDAGETPEGRPFVVMQYVEGQTLRAVMDKGPLALPRLASILLQAAQALAAAHDKGIFHRDLKPENIMIQCFGEDQDHVKIIDFGIAKIQEPSNGSGSTESGVIAGTLAYMAPEQLSGGEVGPATDLYALGIIAYEALTGCLPFQSDFLVQLFELKRRAAFLSLGQFRPGLPLELDHLLAKALAFSPQDRIQNPETWATALVQVLQAQSQPTGSGLSATTPLATQDGETLPLLASQVPPAPRSSPNLIFDESSGGAVPMDSQFYVIRPVDEVFRLALGRQDSIILIKGARQMGKTSLLARGIQQARKEGRRVVLSDLQKLNASDLETAETLYLALGNLIADQLDLDHSPEDVWSTRRAPNINFERFLRKEVLASSGTPLVWAMDEVDRLFSCPFASEVFGLFRSWHNERSLDPEGPWRKLTLVIAYATEAHLFITDINQSPFNVGTRLSLRDFNFEEVAGLNERYGSPLARQGALERFFALLGGQPYLTRRGFHALTVEGMDFEGLEQEADAEEGPYGDHLRRILLLLQQDPAMKEALQGLVQNRSALNTDTFYRMRSAGLILGESACEAALRCELYLRYFRKRL